MKFIFYLVFVFLAALIASFSVTRGISKLSKFIAWREFNKRPKGVENSLDLRFWFNLSSVLALGLGGFASWIWTGNLSFGVVSLLLNPLIFRSFVRYQEFLSARALESSALSFFNALLGLIQSGRGLPSALFDLAQSQGTPFSEKLKKYLKNYEDGRGLSRILIEFKTKTRLPMVGTYLASIEMAYRQGLEIAPLLQRMIPALEIEQHYRSKVEDLRRQMILQAVLAFLMPWVLSTVLWIFNPELFITLTQKNWTQIIASTALMVELLGVWVLWQITSFS